YTDRPVVDPQPVDLARLVRRAVDLTRTRHQLPRESFAYAGPESLRLRGDAQALETAVLKLLDNAVKYSKEKVEVEVEVGADAESAGPDRGSTFTVTLPGVIEPASEAGAPEEVAG